MDIVKAIILINKFNTLSTTQNLTYHFPVKSCEYRRYVGDILPAVLEFVFKDKGFSVDVNWAFQNGVDMQIYHSNTLIIVAEVVNVWKKSFINSKRAEQYIKNLRNYDCNKVVISSLSANLEECFNDILDIDIVCLGFQLLPIPFYEFFKRKKEVDMRKPLTFDTLKEIDSCITEYLENKNLLVHT